MHYPQSTVTLSGMGDFLEVLKMAKEIDEFNKRYSFHDVLTKSGGIPNPNYQPMTYGSGYVYPDYGFMDANGIYQTVIVRINNGKITIHSPFGVTLNDANSFDLSVHIAFNNDRNLALNWKNDSRFGIAYPIPLVDINQITDNALELKELALAQCMVKPNSFIESFSLNLSEVTNIPISTCLMSAVLGFSAASGTCRASAYKLV
jgi:hypothetical protein